MYMKNCFVVLLSYCVGVLCKAQAKIPCDLEDSRCTTSSVNQLYQTIINGVPELGIPPSDPIHQEVIFGYQGDLNYTLTDAYKYGWKDCVVTDHRMVLKDHSWSFTLHCPLLFMRTHYELVGFIAGNYIEGKGLCQITDKQYLMVVRGGFQFVGGIDGKSHLRVTNYGFKRLEVLGNVKYEFHNLYYGDEVRSQQMHNFLNENWKEVSTATHYPAMYSFMGKLLERLNVFLLAVPAEEIFYQNY